MYCIYTPEGYSYFFDIRSLWPSIYRSPPKIIRNFKHPLRKDPKMHRNDPLNIVQFCEDPKKYPQNLHTPKIFFFLKNQNNIEIQNFEPKKNVNVKISDYPSWDLYHLYQL